VLSLVLLGGCQTTPSSSSSGVSVYNYSKDDKPHGQDAPKVSPTVFAVPDGDAEGAEKCPGEYDARTWTNCHGSLSLANGNYVGEFRSGQFWGNGTHIWSDG
jgi:hypothetical protein